MFKSYFVHIILKFPICIVFNPLRAGVDPLGPTLFQRLRYQQAFVSKILNRKNLFLKKCIGYIFAKIMFLIKCHFIGDLLPFLSPTPKLCKHNMWYVCLFLGSTMYHKRKNSWIFCTYFLSPSHLSKLMACNPIPEISCQPFSWSFKSHFAT